MDVLELPRPVINFLRTMSKEMHRYVLCWDIYGGNENVTLTLTWKLEQMGGNPPQKQSSTTEEDERRSADDTDNESSNINQTTELPAPHASSNNNNNNPTGGANYLNMRNFITSGSTATSSSIGAGLTHAVRFKSAHNQNHYYNHNFNQSQQPQSLQQQKQTTSNGKRLFQHRKLDTFKSNNNSNNNNENYYAPVSSKNQVYYRNLSAESQARNQFNNEYNAEYSPGETMFNSHSHNNHQLHQHQQHQPPQRVNNSAQHQQTRIYNNQNHTAETTQHRFACFS